MLVGSKRQPEVQGAREDEGAWFHNSNGEDYGMEYPSTSSEESGNASVESQLPEAISAAEKDPSHSGLEIQRYSPTE